MQTFKYTDVTYSPMKFRKRFDGRLVSKLDDSFNCMAYGKTECLKNLKCRMNGKLRKMTGINKFNPKL